jgi:hypothetical protein
VREIFKPLRNYLRKFDRGQMLGAIWFLANHVDFGSPLPDWLAGANPRRSTDKLTLGFFLWELDTLAREAILHCPEVGGKRVTDWDSVRRAINRLKKTEEEALSPVSEDDVFAEIGRIAHRQFHWQQGISHQDLTRTRLIYSEPRMNDAVVGTFSLSAEQVTQGGFALVATFLKYQAILPIWARNVEKQLGYNVEPLIAALTTTMPAMRKRCLELQSLDQDWAYTFHPLWLHPMVSLGDAEGRIVCPIPGLLMRRLTSGLYFDFVGQTDVSGRYLGPSYQAYVGRVLDAAAPAEVQVLGEERYGPKGGKRDAVDWLVEDASAVMFVECKVLKTNQELRTKLIPTETARGLMRRLAAAIGQTYATMSDALAGNYPHWKPTGKPAYPVVVTLDNWNLLSHVTHGTLQSLVEEELLERGLDLGLLQAHPFAVWHVQEFESGVQVMFEVGIETVMNGLASPDKGGWLFSSYLRAEFPDALANARNLFPDEHRKLIPASLRQGT